MLNLSIKKRSNKKQKRSKIKDKKKKLMINNIKYYQDLKVVIKNILLIYKNIK